MYQRILPAIRTSERAWSLEEVGRRTASAVAWLRAQGVLAGQVVGLISPQPASGPEYLLAMYAIWRLGAIVLPLNPRLPATSLEEALSRAGARWCLGGPESPRRLAWETLPLSPAASGDTHLAYNPEQACDLILTSGSSGKPKLALHSFANHHSSWGSLFERHPLTEANSWLLALPLFHIGGLAIVMRCHAAGATVVMPEPGQDLAAAVTALRPSHLSLVATQLRRLLDDAAAIEALRAARMILLGGSAIPRELIARAHGLGLPIHTSYGSTETSSLVCCTPAGAGLETLYSSGPLLPWNELRFSPDGEIELNGFAIFEGYFESGASLEALMHTIPPRTKQNYLYAPQSIFSYPYSISWKHSEDRTPPTWQQWLRTGDRGYLDAAGNLHISGRIDNLFISGGENIQPEEIEAALLALPGVRQAIVVPVSDAEYGQRPLAFVESEAFDPPAWDAPLRLRLPGFKLPVAYHPWPEQTGLKPSRKALEELAHELRAQAP